MKTKTFAKKLSFNKQTIALLDVKELNSVNAGAQPTGVNSCPDWPGCSVKNVVDNFTFDCV